MVSICSLPKDLLIVILWESMKIEDEKTVYLRLRELSLVCKDFYAICNQMYVNKGGLYWYSSIVFSHYMTNSCHTVEELLKKLAICNVETNGYELTKTNYLEFCLLYTNQKLLRLAEQKFRRWCMQIAFDKMIKQLKGYKKLHVRKIRKTNAVESYLKDEIPLDQVLDKAIYEIMTKHFACYTMYKSILPRPFNEYLEKAKDEILRNPKIWRRCMQIESYQHIRMHIRDWKMNKLTKITKIVEKYPVKKQLVTYAKSAIFCDMIPFKPSNQMGENSLLRVYFNKNFSYKEDIREYIRSNLSLDTKLNVYAITNHQFPHIDSVIRSLIEEFMQTPHMLTTNWREHSVVYSRLKQQCENIIHNEVEKDRLHKTLLENLRLERVAHCKEILDKIQIQIRNKLVYSAQTENALHVLEDYFQHVIFGIVDPLRACLLREIKNHRIQDVKERKFANLLTCLPNYSNIGKRLAQEYIKSPEKLNHMWGKENIVMQNLDTKCNWIKNEKERIKKCYNEEKRNINNWISLCLSGKESKIFHSLPILQRKQYIINACTRNNMYVNHDLITRIIRNRKFCLGYMLAYLYLDCFSERKHFVHYWMCKYAYNNRYKLEVASRHPIEQEGLWLLYAKQATRM